MKKNNNSQRKMNIIYLFIFTAFIPSAVILASSYISSQSMISDTVQNNFLIISKNLKREINNHMNHYKEVVKNLANNPQIKSAAEKGNVIAEEYKFHTMTIDQLEAMFKTQGNTMNIDPIANNIIKNYVKQNTAIKEIFFTNKYGHNVEVSHPTSDFVQSDEGWWKDGFNKGETLEPVEYDESANTTGFTIIVPIAHPETGKPNGVIKVLIDFTLIQKILEASRLGETGEAYLVNQDKLMLTESRFTDDLIKEGQIKKSSVLQFKVDTEGVNKALNNETGFGEYIDYRNSTIAGAYTSLPEYKWALLFEQDEKEVYAKSDTVLINLIIIGLIALLITVILSYFSSKYVERPIKRAIEILLSQSEQIQVGANQVNEASHSLAEGAFKQATSLEETSATLESISILSKNNSNVSEKANSIVEKATVIVGEANLSMNELIQANEDISNTSEETGKIIKIIDEIAFQTNLLALNAAVEAARAGEAGMGFAVVADEVRNLAQRSAEAAKNTSELIDSSIKKIKQGYQLTKNTENQFTSIVDIIKSLKEMIEEVSTSSLEQASNIDQINLTIKSIAEITQDSASSSEETSATSEELSAQSKSLVDVVNTLIQLVGANSSNGSKLDTLPSHLNYTNLDQDNSKHAVALLTKNHNNISTTSRKSEISFPLNEDEIKEDNFKDY